MRSPPRSPEVPASSQPPSHAPQPRHTPLSVGPLGSAHLPPASGGRERDAAAEVSASGRGLGTAAALAPGGSPRRRRRARQGHRGRPARAPGARPRQVTWARAPDSPPPRPLRGSQRRPAALSACAPLRLRLAPGSPIQTDNAPRLLDRPMATAGRGRASRGRGQASRGSLVLQTC